MQQGSLTALFVRTIIIATTEKTLTKADLELLVCIKYLVKVRLYKPQSKISKSIYLLKFWRMLIASIIKIPHSRSVLITRIILHIQSWATCTICSNHRGKVLSIQKRILKPKIIRWNYTPHIENNNDYNVNNRSKI